MALGNAASATATNATAVGTAASAGFANSTAIGNGATTTAANQVAIGTASNTYRMSGVTSAASLAAQTGPTRVVTTDAAGNLAAASFSPQDITSLQSQTSSLQSQLGNLQSQVIYNQREARSGIASALAASNLHYDQRPGKASVALAAGNFRGQSALAGGFGYAVSDRWRVNASFSTSTYQGDFGAAVGSSWTLN
jgi:autotransporter adhesin